MFIIDAVAHNNRMRGVHPLEKFVFSMSVLAVAAASSSAAVLSAVCLIMLAAIVAGARIPLLKLVKLFSIPLVFILFSVTAVAIAADANRFDGFVTVAAAGYWFGITRGSLGQGAALLLRSIAATLCFYFLILTTPQSDIEYILVRLRVPKILRETFVHVYRFIFIVSGMAGNIRVSQKTRLGYRGLGRAYRSLGGLVSSVFIKSLAFSESSYRALLARGYTGEIRGCGRAYAPSARNRIIIAVTVALLAGLEIALRLRS